MNALRVAFLVILICLVPIFELRGGLFTKLVGGLAVGFPIVLLVGLSYGGVAYLQHYILRFLLWRGGDMPWRYVCFLDEAKDRILLHRVGGGYRFVHPLFQEYFASGAVTASPGVAPSPPP